MTDYKQLVEAYLDGEADKEIQKALIDWLIADEKNLEYFIRQANIHGSINSVLKFEHPILKKNRSTLVMTDRFRWLRLLSGVVAAVLLVAAGLWEVKEYSRKNLTVQAKEAQELDEWLSGNPVEPENAQEPAKTPELVKTPVKAEQPKPVKIVPELPVVKETLPAPTETPKEPPKPRTVPSLFKAIIDKDPDISQAATKELNDVLENPGKDQAAILDRAMNDKRMLNYFLIVVSSPSTNIRKYAISAISNMGDLDQVKVLSAKVTDDPDEEVRNSAKTAIREIVSRTNKNLQDEQPGFSYDQENNKVNSKAATDPNKEEGKIGNIVKSGVVTAIIEAQTRLIMKWNFREFTFIVEKGMIEGLKAGDKVEVTYLKDKEGNRIAAKVKKIL